MQVSPQSPSRRAFPPYLILAAACTGVFIAALDQTVVVTALPSVMTDLHIPVTKLDQVAWIITAYLLGYTVAMPLMGRVSGRLRPRAYLSFLLLLFEKGRIGFLDSINGFYQKLADELKGVARASIVSATVLSTEAVEKIRLALSKMTGKEIVLKLEEDVDLIGGIVTRVGDQILDGSIKTQLFNMRESLKRGERV